jgi:hypothetical protein
MKLADRHREARARSVVRPCPRASCSR